MKNIFLLTCLLSFNSVIAQHRKLPPKGSYYSVSKEYTYEKQQGHLQTEIKDGQLICTTDSMIMVFDEEAAAVFPQNKKLIWDSTALFFPIDSIGALLFSNGLLTPDMFRREFNRETKFIDYRGDTVNWTMHAEDKKILVREINQIQKRGRFIKLKHLICFSIAMQFRDTEEYTGIYMFNLILQGGKEPLYNNLAAFFKEAKILSFRYTGFQI